MCFVIEADISNVKYFFGVIFHHLYVIYVLKPLNMNEEKWGNILEGQHRVATGAAAHTPSRLGQQPTAEDQNTHPALSRSVAASRAVMNILLLGFTGFQR